MADYNDTVALGVKQPDPNAQFNTLNNILGFQAKNLDIQAKKQALQGQAAEVQQAQQDASQRQAAAQYFKNFDPSKHIGSDGTLDLNSAMQDPNLNNTGDAKGKIIDTLLGIKKQQLDNATTLSKLDQGTVNNLGQSMNSLREDADVKADNPNGRAKVAQQLQSFAQQNPENARIGQIYGPAVQHAPPGKLADAVNAIGLQAQSVSDQQAQQNPQAGPTLDNGPSILPTKRDVRTGNLSPSANPLTKGLAPTDQPNYKQKVAEATGLGSGSAELQTRPNIEAATGQASDVTKRVSQAISAANNTGQAQDALNRAKAILESPEGPNTGSSFDKIKGIKNFLAGVGYDTKGADDMNTLAKNLARYEAARATQSGLGGTDAARELAHAGSPGTQLDKGALLGVINQSLASEKALASYANVQSKTSDPKAMLKNETDFRSIPNLIQAHEYGMSRTPQEADAKLKSFNMTKEQMKASRDAIKEFESR